MTQAEKYTYWLTFSRFQQSREKFFSPKINSALNKQYEQFIKSYNGSNEHHALMQVNSTSIQLVLKPLYIDAGVTYGAKVRASIKRQKSRQPIGFNERMTELMKAYFESDILNTSEQITNTTRDLIKRVLSEAQLEGLSINEIVSKLQSTELSRARARLIARTETVTAANKGAIFAAKDSGIKLNKEWLAAMDNRTRPDHAGVSGQITTIDGFFDVGGYSMAQPGDRGTAGHIDTPASEICNCRCTVLFIPLRDSQGRVVTN